LSPFLRPLSVSKIAGGFLLWLTTQNVAGDYHYIPYKTHLINPLFPTLFGKCQGLESL